MSNSYRELPMSNRYRDMSFLFQTVTGGYLCQTGKRTGSYLGLTVTGRNSNLCQTVTRTGSYLYVKQLQGQGVTYVKQVQRQGVVYVKHLQGQELPMSVTGTGNYLTYVIQLQGQGVTYVKQLQRATYVS